MVDVTTYGSYKADPDWGFVDAGGHRHVWVGLDVSETHWVQDEGWWCYDCHEQHAESHLECIHCGETIEPGMIPDIPRQVIPGLVHYYLNDKPIDKAGAETLIRSLEL